MIVYPDNNIIVSIEKGNLTVEQIKAIAGTDDIIIPFSAAHMYEADTMSAYDGHTKEELLEKRFKVLDEVSKGKYYFTNSDKEILLVERAAKDAYYSINDYPDQERIAKGFQENMENGYRAIYRKAFGLDVNVINSMPLDKIVPHLDRQLKETGTSSFTELIEEAKTELAKTAKVSQYDKIAMYFGILDLMGFYRDSETDKSDFARMWDSSHADYAAKTSMFLSNDKRARKKAELVYHLLNIHVPVLDTV